MALLYGGAVNRAMNDKKIFSHLLLLFFCFILSLYLSRIGTNEILSLYPLKESVTIPC
jgi:hypothetical protein